MAGIGARAKLTIMVLKVENLLDVRIGQRAQRVAHSYPGAKVVTRFAMLDGLDAQRAPTGMAGHARLGILCLSQ